MQVRSASATEGTMLPSMAASLLVLVVVPLTLLQRCGAAADGNTTMYNLEYTRCSASRNFTSSSPYQLNLAQLLATLPSTAINNSGSFNGTAGSAPDAVFGTAMCQADIPWPDQCNSCLQAATAGASTACSSSKNASVGYRGCVLRYSDTPVPAVADAGMAYLTQYHAASVTDDTITFQQTRTDMFAALSGAAAISPFKLASSNRTFNSTNMMYGLAQCSRYLPEDECSKCIKALITALPATALLSEGVSITGFSCYIRYDLQAFRIYSPDANAEEIPVPALHEGGSIHQTEIIAITVSISMIVLLLAVMVARHYIRERKRAQLKDIVGFTEFSYEEVSQGTENFSKERKLGEGGFGQVYKGNFKVDGNDTTLAVKHLTNQVAAKELLDELKMLAKLEHTNVVKLVGFCSDDRWFHCGKRDDEGLYIFNEYFSNGSLEAHIFGNQRGSLRWSTRAEIIRGVCAGLMYLHRLCNRTISHMDLKPGNILLDQNKMPKIADFGLSRAIEKIKTHTYTTTKIGSSGYMAPEFLQDGKVGCRCDIYSLGVLIMAIVMGDGPTTFHDPCGFLFIDKVRSKFIYEVATATTTPNKCSARDRAQLKSDASLQDDDCLEDVEKCIGLALQCVEKDPVKRPEASYIYSHLPVVTATTDSRERIQGGSRHGVEENKGEKETEGIEKGGEDERLLPRGSGRHVAVQIRE